MSEGNVHNNYSILIIEDNPGDYFLVKEYIEEQFDDTAISHAKSFEVAQKLLNKGRHSFDVLLLDLSLPDLSGEKLINKVLALSGNAITIALTGYSNMEYSIKLLSLGISDYLVKDGLTANDLWKSIRYGLERKATFQSLRESEERYRDLFQSNPNPLIIWELNTEKILDVNREAINKYGYSYKEFTSMKLNELEAEKSEKSAGLNNLEIHMNGSQELRLHKTKDNSTFFAEVTRHRIEYNGYESSLTIVNDVSDKLEMQEKILESTVRAEEEERNRIAKELHDGIVQQLVACGMFTQNLHDLVEENERFDEEIDRLYKLIRNITNETRDLSHNLKSAEFEITSLSDLVTQLTRQLTKDSEIAFTFNNYLSYNDNLYPEFRKHVYRILQELSSNVIKHSQASHAVINIEIVMDRLFLTVKDNGIGFDDMKAQQRGIGLQNIKSRIHRLNGEVRFERNDSDDMQIHIELPVSVHQN